MSSEVKLSTRHALRVLRRGPFRRYIIGSAISDTGTWMQVMAQMWVMTTLTTSALMLGLVNLCSGLPMLALTMVGGSAADLEQKHSDLAGLYFRINPRPLKFVRNANPQRLRARIGETRRNSKRNLD